MGGLPVDRGRSSKMVDQVVELFKRSESMFIVITQEGTQARQAMEKRIL
jgi:hypothetical protein